MPAHNSVWTSTDHSVHAVTKAHFWSLGVIATHATAHPRPFHIVLVVTSARVHGCLTVGPVISSSIRLCVRDFHFLARLSTALSAFSLSVLEDRFRLSLYQRSISLSSIVYLAIMRSPTSTVQCVSLLDPASSTVNETHLSLVSSDSAAFTTRQSVFSKRQSGLKAAVKLCSFVRAVYLFRRARTQVDRYDLLDLKVLSRMTASNS
jgi:hypothetical protein